MEYNNDTLAELIYNADPSANWLFNLHCSYCGKFLYPEEMKVSKCRKCSTDTSKALKRTIPFLSSATAIEKLLMWLRAKRKEMVPSILSIISSWAKSSRSPDAYKLQIVIACVDALQDERESNG